MRTLIAFLLLASAASAGDLIPTDPRYGPLRVASHKVDVQVDNQIALTRIEQVFANDHPATLEAHYTFPEPATLYVTYRTVSADAAGVATFRDDVYGRDRLVVKAMPKP